MSFMQPEVFKTECYVVETNIGTEYVPVDVVGNIGNPDDEGFDVSPLADYCEGTVDDDTDVEFVTGWAYRLSAPGYLDATDMGLADTEAAAYAELLDMYGTDDGEREEWELEAIEIVMRSADTVAQVRRLAREYGAEVTYGTGGKDSPLVIDVTFPEPEPTEPEEGDYILSPCGSLGGKTRVTQYGRTLCEFVEESEARKFVRRHMESSQYWPNVWVLEDHGNYHITTLDD